MNYTKIDIPLFAYDQVITSDNECIHTSDIINTYKNRNSNGILQ
jgi:hypothetical protein